MAFHIQNNYGDNYEVQAGATIVAGGIEVALARKEAIDKIKREAEETGVSFSELIKKYKDNVVEAEVVEDGRTGEPQHIPQSLSGEDVMIFFEKLKRDGILDEILQPKVSNRHASILADYVGSKFKIRTKWKDFAELWGMDKEVLRSTFNNITNNDEDKAFCKRLAKL